jgi:PBP1b-binding outer membrane lipoprotein LpoB
MNFPRVALASSAVSLCLVFAGCATEQDARTIDSVGDQTITTIDQVDIQDYIRAADEMVTSMFDSGAFPPEEDEIILELSRIADESSAIGLNTSVLTGEIRSMLNRSRSPRVLTMTPRSEDARSNDLTRMDQFENAEPELRSDYRLSGQITDVRATAGRTRQSTFVFKMTLTDNRGLGIWEEQRLITKAGTRNRAGL